MRRILVIDDEPPIARLIGLVLKGAGVDHQMDYCSDGAQGKIKAAQGEYDLITLDINMPLMGGVEALQEMKRNPKSAATPVVVVTAEEDAELHRRLMEAGAATVITKPVDADGLGKQLSSVLSGQPIPGPLVSGGDKSELRPLLGDTAPPATPNEGRPKD